MKRRACVDYWYKTYFRSDISPPVMTKYQIMLIEVLALKPNASRRVGISYVLGNVAISDFPLDADRLF